MPLILTIWAKFDISNPHTLKRLSAYQSSLVMHISTPELGLSVPIFISFFCLELQVFFETNVKGLDLSNFEVQQVFYPSKDGTKVPMYILHRKVSSSTKNLPT